MHAYSDQPIFLNNLILCSGLSYKTGREPLARLCDCLDHKTMTPTPYPVKVTAIFQTPQQIPSLDTRDNSLNNKSNYLVIKGVILDLCCGRDGNLSSLHHHLVSKFATLCRAPQQESVKSISGPQLPLLLATVNETLLAKLLFDWFGLELDADLKQWFALDGKESRAVPRSGSIQAGHIRGEACKSELAHNFEVVVQQAYYKGTKKSVTPTVRQLVNQTGLYNKKLVLDVLHRNPLTINAIRRADGVYITGLKANEYHLYRHCLCRAFVNQSEYKRTDLAQRGHGRVDQRSYSCYTLAGPILALRWKDAGLKTVIIVKRNRQELKGNLLSQEVSYFLSNGPPTTQGEAEELVDAIHHHWRIELGRWSSATSYAGGNLSGRSRSGWESCRSSAYG